MKEINEVDRAVAVVGTPTAFARAMGESIQTINQWRTRDNVPTEKCPKVEIVTNGAVSRRHLRPNSWWIIWPELVTAEHPIPEGKS